MHVENARNGRRKYLRLAAAAILGAAAALTAASPSWATTPDTATVSPSKGPSGGGNTVTVTVPGSTTGGQAFVQGTASVEFVRDSSSTCPVTYTTPSSTIVAGGTTTVTGTKALTVVVPAGVTISAGSNTAITNLWDVCVYGGTTNGVSDIFASAENSYTVGADTGTVNVATGPSAGGNSVTVNVANPTTGQEFVQGTTSVEFVADSGGSNICPLTYSTPAATKVAVAPADVRVLGTSRLAVTVPAGVVLNAAGGSPSTLLWDMCVYGGTTASTSPVLAAVNDSYTVGIVPTVTSISPATGPAQGGTSVTITGTNLTTATAAIDGVQLGGQTHGGSTTITGTTVAHTAGGPLNVAVAVSGGGANTLASAFTYTNGITSTPTTTPNTKAKVNLDVRAVGFNAMDFSSTTGTSPDDTKAHVYLTKNAYDPTKSGTWKTSGQAAECLNVLVIDDTELVCSLYPSGGGIPMNPRAITGTVSGTVLTATVGSFTQGDVGAGVTGVSNVPVGTIITSLNDATHAVLSRAASPNLTSASALNLTNNRQFTDATWTNSSKELTSPTANFSSWDVGKVIGGTAIGASSSATNTIVAVNSATSVTLSTTPTTASAAGAGTATITYTAPPAPIPNGTYTVTVVNNGSVDAQNTAGYSRSIITSGSTFTVADY